MPPNMMYVFEYMIYHLKPYGIQSGVTRRGSESHIQSETTSDKSEQTSKNGAWTMDQSEANKNQHDNDRQNEAGKREIPKQISEETRRGQNSVSEPDAMKTNELPNDAYSEKHKNDVISEDLHGGRKGKFDSYFSKIRKNRRKNVNKFHT